MGLLDKAKNASMSVSEELETSRVANSFRLTKQELELLNKLPVEEPVEDWTQTDLDVSGVNEVINIDKLRGIMSVDKTKKSVEIESETKNDKILAKVEAFIPVNSEDTKMSKEYGDDVFLEYVKFYGLRKTAIKLINMLQGLSRRERKSLGKKIKPFL